MGPIEAPFTEALPSHLPLFFHLPSSLFLLPSYIFLLPSYILLLPSSFFPLTSYFFPLTSSIVTRIVPLFASDKKPKIADVAKIANSILRDISDYGDSDRKNQTDDLEFTIGF